MSGHWYLKHLILLFILVIISSKALVSGDDPPKPEFPAVFQVDVQGLLRDEKVEVDGSLYYDRVANRAALHYKHQNEFSITIYNFNDDQVMFIKDYECFVSNIPEKGSFFPYSTDGENKTLNPAEEFFYFQNSVFDREEESVFPSYVFKDTINATLYGLFNCAIFHIFSKPELELPDCDSHTCKPTLVSLSLKCPSPVPGEQEIHHSYNFFRFKSAIAEENVFQPPIGVHCNAISHKPFPDFPPYYSFSYRLIKEQKETESSTRLVYTTYKKIWYDRKLNVIRSDGFGSDGLLQGTKIFDGYGKIAYSIITSVPMCEPDLMENVSLQELYDLTLLPRMFFNIKPEDKENVTYAGKRKVHSIDFDVWTQSYDVQDSQTKVVQEYYFSNNAPEDEEAESNDFEISHVDTYAYQISETTEKYELIGHTYLTISNFRSKQKEWEAFEVSSCYLENQKKEFRLKVEGPPMIKYSYEYDQLLEKLYENLMDEIKVSVIRINQLKGKFDGMYLTEFSGFILEKIEIGGTEANVKEPNMREAVNLIVKAAAIGRFNMVITQNSKDKVYEITPLTVINPDVDPPVPKFQDVFQVDVQGIFHSENREMDGSIFYDRHSNRAAMTYTYQNETTSSIFDFNENQYLYIEDIDCTVSPIEDDTPIFFPFTIDKTTKKKIISTPAEIFFFTKSKFDREDTSLFPSYVFTAVLDISLYHLKNCEVTHIFSKPEIELPDCDSHTCKPTLMSISVKCPPATDQQKEIFHTYNFYRFRSYIKDISVFQPPVGVHCDIPGNKPFPDFPEYYSFLYDILEEQMTSESRSATRANLFKIWHDTKLNLLRVDDFDEDGFVEGTRIFDFNHDGVTYTITAITPKCSPALVQPNTRIDTITPLPKIFFAKTHEEKSSASYIGKRTINGIDYEVWTQTYNDNTNNAKIIQEFYFTESIPEDQNADEINLRISHVDKYTYQKDKDTGKDVLSGHTYLLISNFRSKQKEWEAFDVSSCYLDSQKKEFRLKVEGPPMIKDSSEYDELQEKLYENLMDEVGVSVIRINQLEGKFNGNQLTEFSGFILDKITIGDTEVYNKEPDMREAINLIVKAASIGRFNIVITQNSKEKIYKISPMTVINPDVNPPKLKFPDEFQVDVQGIFHSEKREMDGSIVYDRHNNRAAMTYTYQNETTTSIYDFNENQFLYIEDVDCSVTPIKDDTPTFFPFSIDKVTKKKIISTPEEIFFFTKSKFDREDLLLFPSYVFTAVLDISLYGLKNCEVSHVFSKPEMELPDCDSHTCKPTLLSISVKCPPPNDQQKQVFHTYNFYRFRSYIKDMSVFQPPAGVHCDIPSNKPFPDFPEYYSFSYNILKEQMNSEARAAVQVERLKIWHDTKLKLLRVDDFDEEGFVEGTRIFDFYGRVTYTITAISPNCTPTFLKRNTPLDTITPLPKIFFAKTPEEKKGASYIGKRTINGIDYDVWTQTHKDDLTNAKINQEYYFTEMIPEGQNADKKYLRISHVDKYTYQKDKYTGKDVLFLSEYLSISNYKSEPKEWEAFDIASCFTSEQKKGFRLKVEGPPLVKKSSVYESVLEKLYLKLIILTNASLVRISELQGIFDGIYVTEFTGWILDKLQLNESTRINKEPDMDRTYELIEKAAAEGKLSIKIAEDQIFNVTEIRNITGVVQVNRSGSCTSGGTIAGIAIVTLLIGAVFGAIGYYAFLRNVKKPEDSEKIVLEFVN